jgi:hypothetical protein
MVPRQRDHGYRLSLGLALVEAVCVVLYHLRAGVPLAPLHLPIHVICLSAPPALAPEGALFHRGRFQTRTSQTISAAIELFVAVSLNAILTRAPLGCHGNPHDVLPRHISARLARTRELIRAIPVLQAQCPFPRLHSMTLIPNGYQEVDFV